MRRKKINYEVGSVFVIPLNDARSALGIVARMDGRGIILGYFFDGEASGVCSLDAIRDKKPENAILIGRFGDLGLLTGQWEILGKHPEWRREEWPVPRFVRTDCLTGERRLISYSEDTLDEYREEKIRGERDTCQYPEDGVFGYIAVEIRLRQILGLT